MNEPRYAPPTPAGCEPYPYAIFIVLTVDRHGDIEAMPFYAQVPAIEYAKAQVEENARHPEPRDTELTEEMRKDNWIWYCRYSNEGDYVAVYQRVLR